MLHFTWMVSNEELYWYRIIFKGTGIGTGIVIFLNDTQTYLSVQLVTGQQIHLKKQHHNALKPIHQSILIMWSLFMSYENRLKYCKSICVCMSVLKSAQRQAIVLQRSDLQGPLQGFHACCWLFNFYFISPSGIQLSAPSLWTQWPLCYNMSLM